MVNPLLAEPYYAFIGLGEVCLEKSVSVYNFALSWRGSRDIPRVCRSYCHARLCT